MLRFRSPKKRSCSKTLSLFENAVFLFNSSGDPTLMREGTDTSAVYVVMPMRV